MAVTLAFLLCEFLTLFCGADTVIPQPFTFASAGRQARNVVCRLLAPESRRELRREVMVPSTRQQPASDLQKCFNGRLCISVLDICLWSEFSSEL